MNRHLLRISKTKQCLQSALLQLLKEKSLEKIKVTEICRLANINRGTFYLHYGVVEDIFTELYQDIILDFKHSYNEPYNQSHPLEISTLEPQTIRIFHHIKKYQSFYEIVFSKKASNSYYYMLFDQIRNNLQSSITQENLSERNFDYLIGYHVNAIIGIILVWYQRGFQESPEEMNNQLYYILNKITY